MSKENLINLLDYEPHTGFLKWNKSRQGRANKKGMIVGSPNNEGYLIVFHKRKPYLLHRLIWIKVHGEEPETVDHINHIKTDNRLSNLRSATVRQNCQNRRSRKGSSSKYLGVHWCARKKKWKANIKNLGKQIYIGSFDCEIEAAKSYDKLAIKYFGEFANPNFK